MKVFGAVVLGIVVFVLVVIGLNEFGYRLDQHYQPREEQVRADTFANSQTYNEGMARDLQNLRQAYLDADTAEKKGAIQSTVRQRYAGYDVSKLSPDLVLFYNKMLNSPQQ